MSTTEPLALRGVHHTAFPTWKPKSTVEFYRDALGLPVRHAITAKGWGRRANSTPTFLHFFFDTGDANMLAFFYYIGTRAASGAGRTARLSRALAAYGVGGERRRRSAPLARPNRRAPACA